MEEKNDTLRKNGKKFLTSANIKPLINAKNYYKKMADQLEKMDASDFTDSKIEKLKKKLKIMQSMYTTYNEEADFFATKSTGNYFILFGELLLFTSALNMIKNVF